MQPLSCWAFWNLWKSLFPLSRELAASMTYLFCDMTFSCQLESQVTVSSCWTDIQACPGTSHRGGALQAPTLIETCSGSVRCLSVPVFGCFPRPRNSEGGSMRKFPTFCSCPSSKAYPMRSCSPSLTPRASFFSTSEAAFFAARSRSRCARIREKSHFANDLITLPRPNTFLKSAKKFFWNIPLCSPCSLSCGPSSGIAA
mmetsp:Transcript_18842/g.59197  ORF Transcript_18842/g.59197 Transcript_18842/m.59197 type:complete len:200 (-) Transcript_18842:315-914(-)